MGKNQGDSVKEISGKLIDDSGLIDNKKIRRAGLFVALCRVLSVFMIILGILAIIS